MSRTAVVILNYNGEKLLKQFLPSVIQYSSEALIYLVDNASTDDSITFVKNFYPAINIIALDDNYGYCGGYNRALQQIDAEYSVLLNSDIEVTKNWLTPMIDLLDTSPEISAVQPKVLSFSNKNKFEHAGAAGGFIDTLGYPFCRGRIFNYVEDDCGQYNDEREIFWATGACLMIRSEVFRKFGGFDEDFFAHMEEIDLCWKIHRANQKVFYCGKSTIYHLGAGTLGYQNPRKTYLNFRNGLSLLLKHLGTVELLYKIPIRMILDWLAAVQFLLKGDFKNSAAIFQAHIDFLVHAGRDWNKRKAVASEFPTYDDAMIYKGSVLLDHFIWRQKPDTATIKR